MHLTFLGAAHEVTGSCHYLEAAGKKILIDCGLIQGKTDKSTQDVLGITASEIDYVFLTHAHIDHSGRLPLLSKQGFKGTIYSTVATRELCEIMLRDSAHIQEFEAEWKNRKGKRAGKDEVEPLYTMQDAEDVLKHFETVPYHETVRVADGIEIRFFDAGHLLGSASIEVFVTEGDVTKKILFSGDIGNFNQPILNDPEYTDSADYAVIESTYGTRLHEAEENYDMALVDVIQRTLDRHGNVVIPSFAVGRTQEVLYFIRGIKEKGLVKGHGDFPVFVDSPLAVEATTVFNENTFGYFDSEAMDLIRKGINPLQFKGLCTAVTSDESKAINYDETPKVIISSSGMCEAGRIKHHLKHNLWREESTIVFVGFQAEGTLGRLLLDGKEHVKLLGEEIDVKAEIVSLQGISAHADRNGLLAWFGALKTPPERTFVVHGERESCDGFASTLQETFGCSALAPEKGDRFDLITNTCVFKADPPAPKVQTEGSRDVQYQDMLSAYAKLRDVLEQNRATSNKDQRKIAEDINKLIRKWTVSE